MECSKPKIKPKGERCAKVNRRSKWAVVGCHALVHIYASVCVCVCVCNTVCNTDKKSKSKSAVWCHFGLFVAEK